MKSAGAGSGRSPGVETRRPGPGPGSGGGEVSRSGPAGPSRVPSGRWIGS